MKTFKISFGLDEIEQATENFLKNIGGHKKFAFYGSMGAGKTTFITSVCKKLSAVDLISSPTFSIVNEYETEKSDVIYHFDFYRIKKSEELYDIGFEEYCLENNWCFIEWPEKAEEIIPEEFISVRIEVKEDNCREIRINFPE